ncbi:MAG: response regulator [Planctomycetota bacterium]|nr:response regulator [Planctomycetota bacterium]
MAITSKCNRKQAEENTRRLATVVRDSNDAITIWDFEGRITAWNHGAELMYGYSEEEALKIDIGRLTPPAKEAEQKEFVRRLIAGETVTSFDTQRVTKDGRILDVWLTVTKLVDDAGKPISVASTERDITERKRAEEALRKSIEERFKKLFVEAPLGIAVIDSLTGHIYEVNPMFAKIAGRTMEEMVQIDWMSITHPDDVQEDLDNMALLNAGKINGFQMEKRYLHHDGTAVWINMTIASVKVEDNAHPHHLCMIEDITERKRMERQLQEHAALKTGQAELTSRMLECPQMDVLCRTIITFLCKRLEVPTGLMYLAGEDGTLSLAASYAHKHKKHLATEFKPGEGLVGQAALEKQDIILADVPQDYFTIESGLGEAVPRHIHVKPIVRNGKVKAVIELGTLQEFAESQLLFLNAVTESIAIAVESAQAKDQARLLEESQRLYEELQAQQEELEAANEELEQQAQRLKESEDELKAQQVELQGTNEELEEKNDLLDRQKRDVEKARKDIEKQAEELALASKYKSEFLANMSHELRTPLNSLLLLSGLLAENKNGNLTPDQVEAARVIHNGGMNLLSLINEILDLAKIEAGRMDLDLGAVLVSDLAGMVRDAFQRLAGEKGLALDVNVADGVPDKIVTDRKRVEQIIGNLVSNAVKFTEKGGVTVTFRRPADGADLSRSGLSPDGALAIEVKDTGIDIPPEKHAVIFKAFRQADGSTTRRYGGTGLGLSISSQLARLLGGEIDIESEPGRGSTFTAYLPIAAPAAQGAAAEPAAPAAGAAPPPPDSQAAPDASAAERRPTEQVPDDRDALNGGDHVCLVIEDDPKFAEILRDQCRQKGFRCIVSPTGEGGLALAKERLPVAVILDLRLPGIDGWAVLDALKGDPRTRHIPVHIISDEEAATEALRRGAVGHIAKRTGKEDIDRALRKIEEVARGGARNVLVAEDDGATRRSMVELIGNGDVHVDEASTGREALEAIRAKAYDCVVLDLGLPDMDGMEFLDRLVRETGSRPPIIVCTARDLTREQEMNLREQAASIVLKDGRFKERLLDEVSLFLHRVVGNMPERKRRTIAGPHNGDPSLEGAKVLIVDDDAGTTFALSQLLADHGVRVLKAEDGEKALRVLQQEPTVDLVLMDIMMPVMDGYEAIGKIRAQERFRNLPIIALTAKAMAEDRQRCLTAGASDYLPKPLDKGRLISMMRVWLYRKQEALSHN